MKIATTIDLSGPFFTKDVTKTLNENIVLMLEAVAEEGELDVRDQLVATQEGRLPISRLGDRVSDHVRGRVVSLASKHWQRTAVISVNNSGFGPYEGRSLMAAASKVEGATHAFRRTTSRLKRARAVNRAELMKGLE